MRRRGFVQNGASTICDTYNSCSNFWLIMIVFIYKKEKKYDEWIVWDVYFFKVNEGMNKWVELVKWGETLPSVLSKTCCDVMRWPRLWRHDDEHDSISYVMLWKWRHQSFWCHEPMRWISMSWKLSSIAHNANSFIQFHGRLQGSCTMLRTWIFSLFLLYPLSYLQT